MFRRVRPHSTLNENFKLAKQVLPWRLFLLIPFLLVFAIPAFLLGTGAGHRLLPNLTNFFYTLANTTPTAFATPMPAFILHLPQPGSIVYTAQDADSCDEILATRMHMADAGQIFSDAQPNTVAALNSSLGLDCGNLQPGTVVKLMPQYPLVALGGLVLSISSLSAAQPIPTPLIPVHREQQLGVDCSNGCLLTLHVAREVTVKLSVQTAIPIQVGAWVWAQAMYPRKAVAGFANYPYTDSTISLNSASLNACDLQINNTHDDNSSSCDQLTPNTIDDDGGAWIFGVTGAGGIDHWNYHLSLPEGTQVLLWLSLDKHGNLVYRAGNPLYRYDATTQLYVKV